LRRTAASNSEAASLAEFAGAIRSVGEHQIDRAQDFSRCRHEWLGMSASLGVIGLLLV
jgi:hypothetical protein